MTLSFNSSPTINPVSFAANVAFANVSGDKNDVWSSPDGITSTQATFSAAWSTNRNAASAVYDGKMWFMGGSSNGNEVWSSTNGSTWPWRPAKQVGVAVIPWMQLY